MTTLYWLEEALTGIPATLWMFFGVGLPWALAALSTKQWGSRTLVLAVALALGPAWMTAWMLILGVAGAQLGVRTLTVEWILPGSALIALAGAAIAWRKRHLYVKPAEPRPPLAFDERLIIALIVIAIVLRWIHTAFWTFTTYDALWVYGFQARLYFLEGNIPHTIDYYPQFLQLQFAFVQVLTGVINDHAARMVLPLLHIGSILAAYLLGARLLNRRVGIFAAALWSLHPHIGQWAGIGDLEIPLTFSFTLAAVFYLRAWLERDNAGSRRRDAILAGVMLGIALFTKPTAGAFIWGVLLLLAVDLIRLRFDIRSWLPRFTVAFWTGLACLPLGAVWYVRNLALGHDVITWPKAVWLTRALRSGDYLGPLLAAVLLGYIAIALRKRAARRDLALGAAGTALMLAGALASKALFFPTRADPPASYVRPDEALMLIAGLTMIAFSLRRYLSQPLSQPAQRMLSVGGWSLLLALPYFVTFFLSYSYHYRLGFAIVPLLCLPTAIALSVIFAPSRMQQWRGRWRFAYALCLLLLSLPGVFAVALNADATAIWLLRSDLNSDISKYQTFNPSLMEVVFGLQDFRREAAREPIVLAPGEERLPFFFPQMRIDDQIVTELDELEELGATHFVYSARAREAYQDAGLDPNETQLIAAQGRLDLFRLVKAHHEGTFSYQLYEILDLSSRRELPRFMQKMTEVTFGDRIQLYMQGPFPSLLFRETPITINPTWRALQPLSSDYQFVLQLVDAETDKVWQEWIFQVSPHRYGAYSTTNWRTDEVVKDQQILQLDPEAQIPRGDTYIFRLGIVDPVSQDYLPLKVAGTAAGQWNALPGTFDLRT